MDRRRVGWRAPAQGAEGMDIVAPDGPPQDGRDMEHRYSNRVPATLCAELRIAGAPGVTATTRNICKDGLFLGFSHPGLRHNQILEVILYVPGSPVRWRTRAIVIHVCRRGAGMLLAEQLSPAIYRAATQAGSATPPIPFEAAS
jgi:hypothetical protein